MSDFLTSLWRATANPAPETGPLDGERVVDFAVVGGGYTGLSTALHLAERGASVAVAEQHDIGFGASGRNGGQVNPGIKIDPPEVKRQYSPAMAERILELSGGAPDKLFEIAKRHNIDCEPIQRGWVLPAHNAAALEKLKAKAEAWQARGVGMRVLGPQDTNELLGCHGSVGGVLDPRGGSVHPMNLVLGLAKAAIGAGAQVFTRTVVDQIDNESDGWSVRTRSGRIRARKVMIATNAYTGPLWPRLSKTVIAANSYQIATEELPDDIDRQILPDRQTATDSRRVIVYFRRYGRRFVIGGRGLFDDPKSTSDFEHLRKTTLSLYPILKSVKFKHHWSGRVAMTMDGLPHIHEPHPGLLIALGYNGRGVALSTALGPVFAAHLLGDPDVLPFGSTPIRPVPLHGLQRLYVGAALVAFRVLDSF